MSRAIQCDRCKEFFSAHGEKPDVHENWVKIHNRDRNIAGIDKFDLCDMCYGALMTFMEQYKNEQTEN